MSELTPKRTVLDRYYPRVIHLVDLIRCKFSVDLKQSGSKHNNAFLSEEDWIGLHQTLVGISEAHNDSLMPLPGPAAPVECTMSIRDAVLEAQLQILFTSSSSRTSPTNILLKGYKRPDERLEGFRMTEHGRAGLINLYPNSMVTKLVMGRQWAYLYNKVGTDAFIWLLANTAIFVPIINDVADGTCYIQLSGVGIYELPELSSENIDPSSAPPNPSSRKRKRKGRRNLSKSAEATKEMGSLSARRLSDAPANKSFLLERTESRSSVASEQGKPSPKGDSSSGVTRKLSDILLVRSRIFYARASRDKSGRVELGLPAVHVFNRSASEKELNKVLPSPPSFSSSQSHRAQLTLARLRKTRMSPPNMLVKKEASFRAQPSHPAPKPDQTLEARRARHLSKYIFPRQYRLHNVFNTTRDFETTTQLFRDYTVRESEIKSLGTRGTPKRLKLALPILAKILRRHDKLNYRILFDRCCPTRLPKRKLTAEERLQIAEDLAEADAPPRATQNRAPSQGTSCVAAPAVDVNPSGVRKPKYTNYAVESAGQVAHYVTLVVRSLLPRELFGSAHNQRLVLRWIGNFVRLRRYETLNLHQIFQSFRINDVEWTLPSNPKARHHRPTRSESNYRRELVLEVLYWIFDSLVIPLIRTSFYVTESAAYRNRVLYFRQDDWHVISKPVLLNLRQSIFEPLTRSEALGIMSERKLGYSHVRLLPKETGVRPIVNLRRRSTKQVHQPQLAESASKGGRQNVVLQKQIKDKEAQSLGQSINYILQSAFHILTYEKNRLLADGERDGMLQSSVFGPNEIYTKLKGFRHQLDTSQRGVAGNKRKLYFVKVDVRCAFDSIDQEKLLRIIEEILTKDHRQDGGYRIHRFAKVMPTSSSSAIKGKAVDPSDQTESEGNGMLPHPRPTSQNATKRDFVKLARPDEAHISFFDLASELATALHNIVFVDSVMYRYEDSARILALLEQHVTENLIKIGKEFYRQRIGIPQGSSLSTLLCNFFYADMERTSLPFLRKRGRSSLLLRYTDDFLLITTSKRQAKQFYSTMNRGHPKYGCFISPEKSLVNFDLLDRESSNPFVPRVRGRSFPWCGISIDTVTLGVESDLERYRDVDMRDTLTVEMSRKPGVALVEKMIQTMKPRCHILYNDTGLNGEQRVYRSIYTAFLISALKLVAYLAELQRFKVAFKADFLYRAILKLVRFTSRYIVSRAAAATAKLQSSKRKHQAASTTITRGRTCSGWRVNCAVQSHFVHWLGFAAFLAVFEPKRRPHGLEMGYKKRAKQIDQTTRQELVKMLEDQVYRRSVARKRMVTIAQYALTSAKHVLDI